MYNAGLVCCIKSDGKILRENKDEIFLQFNSEYSILLKNLDSRKALVKISIDGQDVLDNNSLIIDHNSETELEGFMKGSVAKNKFKFIKKTQEISDHRGDRIDDGIIRVEYCFEQLVEKKHIVTEHVYYHYDYGRCSYNCRWCNAWACPYRLNRWFTQTDCFGAGGPPRYGSIGSSCGTSNDGVTFSAESPKGYENLNSKSVNCYHSSVMDSNNEQLSSKSILREQPVPDEGITVKGSETYQVFRYANIGPLEDTSRVILLRLIGSKESGVKIYEPVTVKTKKKCSTCGKKSKSHLKFCSSCGTFLE